MVLARFQLAILSVRSAKNRNVSEVEKWNGPSLTEIPSHFQNFMMTEKS